MFRVQNFKYGYLVNLQNYYDYDLLCTKTANCSFASTVYSHFASVPTWVFMILSQNTRDPRLSYGENPKSVSIV